jgi:hypothetical protein
MRRTGMKRLAFLILALALAAASCGDAEQTDDETTVDLNEDPPTLLLEIEDQGGFVPIEYTLGSIPRYTLFSDGMLFYQGGVNAIYPGPLLSNVLGVKLEPADMADVKTAIEAIGLADIAEEINNEVNNVADAGTLVATYYDDAGPHRYGVYAFGIGSFSDPRVEDLGNLVLLFDQIVAESPGDPEEASRMQVYVGDSPYVDPQLGTVEPWAFDFDPTALTAEPFGFACTVLEEPQGTEAWFTFSRANQQTFWDRDGITYQLIPVPLFYDQPGCV